MTLTEQDICAKFEEALDYADKNIIRSKEIVDEIAVLCEDKRSRELFIKIAFGYAPTIMVIGDSPVLACELAAAIMRTVPEKDRRDTARRIRAEFAPALAWLAEKGLDQDPAALIWRPSFKPLLTHPQI